MSIADAWPEPGEPLPAGDPGSMPDDGHRHELPDGTLIMSPAPGLPHQVAAAILCHALELACPEDLVAFLSAGAELGVPCAVGPDAVVARRSGTRLVMPPLLVAEVLPPGSGRPGQDCKRVGYERFGVPLYWMIDPDPERPSLRAFQLIGGKYRETAQVAGDMPFRVQQPFPVEIVPSRLVAKLRVR